MELEDRIGLDTARRRLIDRVLDEFPLDTTGLYLVLDNGDFSQYPNQLYRKPAFFLDVANGELEEMSPDHVLAIMQSPACCHLIWLSPRLASESPAQLVWVLSHELQHMSQSVTDRATLQLGHLLARAYPSIIASRVTQLEIPTEFDAELTARDTVARVLGEDALRAHLSEAEQQDIGRSYFRRFREIEASWSGDVRCETISLFEAHEREFREFGESNECSQCLPDR